MSKKKNDSNLSIEERLEQALIPNWDEPYKLPDNWCWVRIDAIALIYTGNSINERIKKEKYLGRTTGLVYLATKDISFDATIDYETNVRIPENEGFKVAPKYSTLLCVEGGSAGRKIGYVAQDVCFVNKLCAFVPSDNINSKYLYYALQSQVFKNQFNEKKHGLIGGVSVKDVSAIYVPLAPLKQQTEIVERIESLFTILDEAKEKAQEVVDGFESRKAAILHKAFSGELTKKWRKEKNISITSWTYKKINQVCVPRAGYAFDSKKFTNTGYQIIRMGNLYDGRLELSRKPVFVSEEDINELILKRALINDGDILITLTGTKYKRDYGYAVCIHNPINLLVNQRILCLTPNQNEITTNYILYYLQSDIFRDIFFSNETGGVNQGNVSSKFVENIQINIPTYKEQEEIGRLLEKILEKERQAKSIAEDVIQQIETIKKTILAKAFRGELATNNLNDENAYELIKRILQEDKNEEVMSSKKKIKSIEVTKMKKTILEALNLFGRLTPEKLKAETQLNIDDFYSQLKELINQGEITELRIDGESYLEAIR